MNKDKAIKDLRKRNDKLFDQYRLRDFRCITLEQRIDRVINCIENFLCTEDYINVNGNAIADNYAEVLNILKGGNDE